MSPQMTLFVWDESHWTLEGAKIFASRMIDEMPDYFEKDSHRSHTKR
jgi:hypothetical protein